MAYNDPYNNSLYNPIAGFVDTTPREFIAVDPRTGQLVHVQRSVHVVRNSPQTSTQAYNQGYNQGYTNGQAYNQGYANGYNQAQNQTQQNQNNGHHVPQLTPAQLMNQLSGLRDNYRHPSGPSHSTGTQWVRF